MKIYMTFEGLTVEEAARLVAAAGNSSVVLTESPVPEPQQTVPDLPVDGGTGASSSSEAAKPKTRKPRRTKAQMAEARAAEAAPDYTKGVDAITGRGESIEPEDPTPRRRRTAATTAEQEATPRRRRTPEPDDESPQGMSEAHEGPKLVVDEVSDADVAKAASAAAEILTPDVVMAVLEEFGVASVDMLDQDARRDFIAILDQKVDDSLPNG